MQVLVLSLASLMSSASWSSSAGINDMCTSPETCREQLQALLQVQRKTTRNVFGDASTAPLNEEGYQSVASLCCSKKMIHFIKRIIADKNYEICDEGGVSGVTVWHDCTDDKSNFAKLESALEEHGLGGECPFLRRSEDACPQVPSHCLEVVQGEFLPCNPTTEAPTILPSRATADVKVTMPPQLPTLPPTQPPTQPPAQPTTKPDGCGPLSLGAQDSCVLGTSYASGPDFVMKRCKSPYQLGGSGSGPDTVDVQSVQDCASRCDTTQYCVAFDVFQRDSGLTRCSLCKDLPNKCLAEEGITNANNNGQHYYRSSGCP